jgi:hypothetical protein
LLSSAPPLVVSGKALLRRHGGGAVFRTEQQPSLLTLWNVTPPQTAIPSWRNAVVIPLIMCPLITPMEYHVIEIAAVKSPTARTAGRLQAR